MFPVKKKYKNKKYPKKIFVVFLKTQNIHEHILSESLKSIP
jgi:hypothetical protein